uniref:Putative methyltransferase NSUN3 n=1 Tax=Lygus hesperus TaxID=30085 RepID=A0A0A9Y2H2_LYGHE
MVAIYQQNYPDGWEPPLIHPTPLPLVYCTPPGTSLAKTNAYRGRWILGGNLSSLICVSLLQLEQGSTVLDLCCAPGTKLVAIAQSHLSKQLVDPFEHHSFYRRLCECAAMEVVQPYPITDRTVTPTRSMDTGTVVGVDVSERRLQVCAKVVTK